MWGFALLAAAGLALAGWAGYHRPAIAREVERFATDILVLARVEGYADEIEAAAVEAGLDPCLLAAIVYSESSGKADAVSKVGAVGLMQLVPDAAKDAAKRLGLAEVPSREQLVADPLLNLRLGASHFAWTLRHEGGDVERALVAYNAGRTRLAGWIREAGSYEAWRAGRVAAGDSPTLAYARRVLDYRRTFRERGVLFCAPDEPHGE
ncbi:MAG: lytic transglycosylase domain-containing protein [Planctomycetes bacterium]|nr:lytic transglycosylase domain-containing protein [Planctomycetota bacterium]